MFLPQVVKSARVMKKRSPTCSPIMEAEKAQSGSPKVRGKILMATVKGDVHDIGKNIVGVVLGCNNYQVIDLGVMVPCEKILETASRERVDLIGLSGLITPSLDEMVYVVREIERTGFNMPLLIGGPRPAPSTRPSRFRRLTASPPSTCSTLRVGRRGRPPAEAEIAAAFVAKNRRRTRRLVASYERRQEIKLVPYAEALANKFVTDWRIPPDRPAGLPGHCVLDDYPLEKLLPFIDWSPFFMSWELKGKYPRIFDDPHRGGRSPKAIRRRPAVLDGSWPSGCWGPSGCMASGRPLRSATTSCSSPTTRGQHELARVDTLRQQWERKGQSAFYRPCPISSLRSRVAGPTTWAPLPSRPAWGTMSWWPARARSRRLQRDPGQSAGRSAGRAFAERTSKPARIGVTAKAKNCRTTT